MADEKKVIAYFEDDRGKTMIAEDTLSEKFPECNLIFDKGVGNASESVDRVIKSANGIEKIALVCTDGHLLNCKGWEILTVLREKGYRGPAVYTGFSILPEEFKGLYQIIIGDELLSSELRKLELNL